MIALGFKRNIFNWAYFTIKYFCIIHVYFNFLSLILWTIFVTNLYLKFNYLLKSLTVKKSLPYLLFDCSSFFCIILNFHQISFSFCQENFFYCILYCRSLGMNFLSLCWFGKVFIMPPILKVIFTRYINMIDSYYCLCQHFKYLMPIQLSSVLYSLWQEVQCISSFYSSLCNASSVPP